MRTIAIALWLLQASTLQASPIALTADEVARRATSTSLELAAQRAKVEAAQAAVTQALAGYLPRVNLSLRYTRLSSIDAPSLGLLLSAPTAGAGPVPAGTPLVNVPVSFPSLVDQYVFQANLSVPLSDYLLRVRPAHQAARLGLHAADASTRAARARVESDARLVYYQWIRARWQVEVAELAMGLARHHRHDVNLKLRAGTASKADALRVEAQLASAELLHTRSRQLAALLEQQLRLLMHDRRGRPYRVGEDLDRPAPLGTANAQEAQRDALRRRQELVALELGARAQDSRARGAAAAWWPRLDVVANAYVANPHPRVFPQADEFKGGWDLGLSLSYTPTDALQAHAARRAALAQAARLRAQAAQLRDGIRLEVLAARSEEQEAQQSISTARRQVAAATESHRVRLVLYRNGKATSVELIDAETELVRARLAVIDALINARVAATRLRYATGHFAPRHTM